MLGLEKTTQTTIATGKLLKGEMQRVSGIPDQGIPESKKALRKYW